MVEDTELRGLGGGGGGGCWEGANGGSSTLLCSVRGGGCYHCVFTCQGGVEGKFLVHIR